MIKSLIDSKRYREIRDAAGQALVEHSDGLMPVKPRDILRDLSNSRCIPFMEYKRRMRLPADATSKVFFGTQDAHTAFQADTNQYIVVYNDDDRAMSALGRIRWTLAHELGHVILGHLAQDAGKPYALKEQEADYFAAMLLAYPALIKACGISSPGSLQAFCGLSAPAAAARFTALQRSTMGISTIDELVLKHFGQVIWERNLPFETEPDFSQYSR